MGKRLAEMQSWPLTLVLRAAQFMGDVLLSAKERLKVDMRNAAAQFERFEGDSGSTEVQGAPRCTCSLPLVSAPAALYLVLDVLPLIAMLLGM